MSEDEEFEFRLRHEQELADAAKAAQPVAAQPQQPIARKYLKEPEKSLEERWFPETSAYVNQKLASLPNWLLTGNKQLRGVVKGAGDPTVGTAQLLANVVGQGGGLNQWAKDEETKYQQRRGDDGIDWWRGGGNVISPANLMVASKLPVAATLLGRTGQGAGLGAMSGLMNPETGENYGMDKAKSVVFGALAGGMLPWIGGSLSKASDIYKDLSQDAAKWLMLSALKPTMRQHKTGAADVAAQTLLDYGINATKGGVGKIKGIISDLNDEISSKIAESGATIDKQSVLNALKNTKEKFLTQVDPAADLAAIEKVSKGFSSHPFFNRLEPEKAALEEVLKRAELGKIQALQAAGKLKTFAQQQKNLGQGENIALASLQPENQLYFNVGKSGERALSPSAYPVAGMPRVPGRYTHNIDRVSEGESGAIDAMKAYEQKKIEEIAARKSLEDLNEKIGTIPIQQAQKMKQGTYRVLRDKYGQIGSAETEAQKDLARGLKEQIAEKVPEISALNAAESRLINTLDVAERRALMDANKNPNGLALLSTNPASWAAFMADKSALFKSLAARMINNSVQPGPLTRYGRSASDVIEKTLEKAKASPVTENMRVSPGLASVINDQRRR